jgi:hypothetical protein
MVSLTESHTSARVSSLLRRTRPLHVIIRLLATSVAAAATALDTARVLRCLRERSPSTAMWISLANLRWMSAVEELLAIRTVNTPSCVLYTTFTAKSIASWESLVPHGSPLSAPPFAALVSGAVVAWAASVAGTPAALIAAAATASVLGSPVAGMSCSAERRKPTPL